MKGLTIYGRGGHLDGEESLMLHTKFCVNRPAGSEDVCSYQLSGHWLQQFLNQRTNGPVNAHLISWPSKEQNYDGLESPMLHTKFGGNRPAGSGEEDF